MQALYAIIVSNLLIMVYLWVRFERLMYGVAAVASLVHDVLIAIGFLAISSWLAPVFGFLMVSPFKIGLTEVAAILTLVGFSVNDTVVIFDRIREVKGKTPLLTPEILNASINQTLSRTILTSLTVLLVSIVLYVMGGPTIHAFAYTMTIGVITGTYSSIYVAAPLLFFAKSSTVVKQRREKAELSALGGADSNA
jgi:SecD/SecF fusion protein